MTGSSHVKPDVGVIIVAAGSGTRVGDGEPKQFRWIAGKPMLLHSVHAFMQREDVAVVVCVLPQRYAGDPPPWLFQSDTDRLLVSVGGVTRMESVYNGLEDLPDDARIVIVHDAARPFVGQGTIDRVIAQAREGRAATAALPVVDTLKEVQDGTRIERTVDRDRLWRAQTPQAFPRDLLYRAHLEGRRARIAATDDMALCERIDAEMVVVLGSERALKVTTDADFARAEALYSLPE